MGGIIFLIFIIGLILLLGFVKCLLALQRPRVYPSKYVLKQRMKWLGSGSAVCIGLAILFLLLF